MGISILPSLFSLVPVESLEILLLTFICHALNDEGLFFKWNKMLVH